MDGNLIWAITIIIITIIIAARSIKRDNLIKNSQDKLDWVRYDLRESREQNLELQEKNRILHEELYQKIKRKRRKK